MFKRLDPKVLLGVLEPPSVNTEFEILMFPVPFTVSQPFPSE